MVKGNIHQLIFSSYSRINTEFFLSVYFQSKIFGILSQYTNLKGCRKVKSDWITDLIFDVGI